MAWLCHTGAAERGEVGTRTIAGVKGFVVHSLGEFALPECWIKVVEGTFALFRYFLFLWGGGQPELIFEATSL